MSRYHPRLIERARRSVVTHDPDIPPQRAGIARVVQWIILRDNRPPADAPQGEIIPFSRSARPCWPPLDPFTPAPGGSAA